MSCSLQDSRPDWKAYALGELNAPDRHAAESHAATCPGCRDELATLRLTLDSLSTLRDEEVPRRIAFVSDKVFEPRWWQSFFRPSFAAGCVVAAAILVHAFVSRGPSDAAIQAAVDSAVTKAVVQVDARNAQEIQELLTGNDPVEIYKRRTLMYARDNGMVRQ